MDSWRYRIAIVNDFRDTYAFLDYKKFSEVIFFEACFVSGAQEKNQLNNGIGVFKNYQRTLFVKNKKDALQEIESLINSAPAEAQHEFNQYKNVLLKSLGIELS